MTGARSEGGDVESTGRPGPVTRRRFVAAAAAAAGLGTVGTLSGGGDAGTADGNVLASAESHAPRSSTRVESATPPAETETAAADTDAPASDALTGVDTPVLGANLNGRPRRLLNRFELIDASDTQWVRAFVDVRKKLAGGVPPERDPDVRALRRAARERDCRLIVNIKWDFKANWGDKVPMRVPAAGSRSERDLCECAARYLAAVGPVDVVVLGNEPMWETLPADIEGENSPLLRFTRTAKEHLVGRGDHGDPTYLVGAFNRLDDDHVRERRFGHFCREAFEMVREDPDVDGVDLHLHYDGLAAAEEMLAVVRDELPDATLAVTEFSPVLRYARHVHDPLSASAAGERFARARGLPPEMTAVEYFEYAKQNPRSPEELAAFYDAMPWYNVDHVEDIYALFSTYGVSIGTFGLLQGEGMRNEDWTAGWEPFHINFLFQPALLRTDRGIERTAHPHYVEDYRRWTGRV